MIWALLPVKDLVRAKSRLAGVLAPHERRALAQAMVEDVIATLTACRELDGVLMVSDDPGAELLAHRYGVELLQESDLDRRGLNPVVAAACGRLASRGVDAVMVVHSDLPLLRPDDISALLAVFRRPDVDLVLSPDAALDGTNIFVFDLAHVPEFGYGPGSCSTHREAARRRGWRLEQVSLNHVALDVDEPADLIALSARTHEMPATSLTARFINTPPLRGRLAVLARAQQRDSRGTGS